MESQTFAFHVARAVILVALSVLGLSACGGSGGGGPEPVPPVVSSFSAAKSTASTGVGTTLKFSFSGGAGSVNQGVGTVTSGVDVFIDPAAATIYTLTVTSPTGTTATASTTVNVVPFPVINWIVQTRPSARPGGAAELIASFGGGTGILSGPAGIVGTMLPSTPLNAPVAAGASYRLDTFTLQVTNAAGDSFTRSTDVAVSRFTLTGALLRGRKDFFLTPLQDGRVLAVGGATPAQEAEIYTPAADTFALTGALPGSFVPVSSTRLADGRVLVVSSDAAQLFSPGSGTFSPTGAPLTARPEHRAALLQDGRVLLVGGAGDNRVTHTVRSAELYDPVTGQFTYTTGLTARNASMYGHTLLTLNSGKVLICGGNNSIGAATTSACELFDPAAQTFSATGSMAVPRVGPTSTLLADGRVLVAGGSPAGTNGALWGPEIYDPVTGIFTPSGTLAHTRVCSALALADGTVALLGIYNNLSSQWQPNLLFNPQTLALTDIGPMAVQRDCDFAPALLQSGRVLIAGGSPRLGPFTFVNAELFY